VDSDLERGCIHPILRLTRAGLILKPYLLRHTNEFLSEIGVVFPDRPLRFLPDLLLLKGTDPLSGLAIYEFQGSGDDGLFDYVRDFEAKWGAIKGIAANVQVIPRRILAEKYQGLWTPIRPEQWPHTNVRGIAPAWQLNTKR